MNQRAILGEVIEAVLNFHDGRLSELIRTALDEGIDVTTLINDGLTVGLRNPDELFHFLHERLEEISGIISTETFYVMRDEKINYEWKLPTNIFD